MNDGHYHEGGNLHCDGQGLLENCPVSNQPSPERRVAMREQALKDLAMAVSTYYHELRRANIPQELAFALTADYQMHWFETERGQT